MAEESENRKALTRKARVTQVQSVRDREGVEKIKGWLQGHSGWRAGFCLLHSGERQRALEHLE